MQVRAQLAKDLMASRQPVEGLQSDFSLQPQRTGTTRRELERSLLYSEELGIDLGQGTDDAYFHWFLASLLFGARISETTAKNTYGAFIRHGLTTPAEIVAAGWDFLVSTITSAMTGASRRRFCATVKRLSPAMVAACAGCTIMLAMRAILRIGCLRFTAWGLSR